MNNNIKVWISGIDYPYDGWTLTGIWSTKELATECATTPVNGHSWTPDTERENEWIADSDYNTDRNSSMVAFIQEFTLDQVSATFQTKLNFESKYREYLEDMYGEKNKDNGEN